MTSLLQEIEQQQLKSDLPDFNPGDTVVVQLKVKEGNRERLQAFEGVVIAKRNRGLNSSFTVRKLSHGEGVERVFQTHSRQIASITVKRRGDVRRAKLYYLRGLTGKKARIKEKIKAKLADSGAKLVKSKKNKSAAKDTPATSTADAAATDQVASKTTETKSNDSDK